MTLRIAIARFVQLRHEFFCTMTFRFRLWNLDLDFGEEAKFIWFWGEGGEISASRHNAIYAVLTITNHSSIESIITLHHGTSSRVKVEYVPFRNNYTNVIFK